MKREVNTKTAVLVIGAAVLLIAVWAHFSMQAKRVDSPGFVKVHPSGNVVLKLGQQFYITTPDGADVARFSPVTDDSSAELVGDFDFFSNGDMLVYVSGYQASALEQTATVFRLADDDARQALPGEGFYRCDLSAQNCWPFGHDLPTFTRGFRVAINEDNQIALADTARHRLFKINEEGHIVARHEAGLRFPNDLVWQDGTVWVVNTNRNAVQQFDDSDRGFGKTLTQFSPNVPQRRYPADLAFSDQHGFVITMDNAMQQGKLVQFDRQGAQVQIAPLDVHADPLTVTHVADRLIVADERNLRYRQLAASDLTPLADFSSPAIAAHLSRSLDHKNFYENLAWAILLLGGVGFLALLVVAVRAELGHRQTHAHDTAELSGDASLSMPPGQSEYWIPLSRQLRVAQTSMRWLLPALGLMALLVLYPYLEKPEALVAGLPFALMLLMLYLSWRVVALASRMGVGIRGEQILLRDHRGQVHQGTGAEVRVSNSALCVGTAIVMIKSLDQKEFERWVKPRLAQAQRLNEVQMLARQWQVRHPVLMEMLKLIGIMAVAVVALELWPLFAAGGEG